MLGYKSKATARAGRKGDTRGALKVYVRWKRRKTTEVSSRSRHFGWVNVARDDLNEGRWPRVMRRRGIIRRKVVIMAIYDNGSANQDAIRFGVVVVGEGLFLFNMRGCLRAVGRRRTKVAR